jgi:hypothetical protein
MLLLGEADQATRDTSCRRQLAVTASHQSDKATIVIHRAAVRAVTASHHRRPSPQGHTDRRPGLAGLIVRRLGFASHMQPRVGVREPHLKHLILQSDLLAVQEPDITRIFPSSCRSITTWSYPTSPSVRELFRQCPVAKPPRPISVTHNAKSAFLIGSARVT